MFIDFSGLNSMLLSVNGEGLFRLRLAIRIYLVLGTLWFRPWVLSRCCSLLNRLLTIVLASCSLFAFANVRVSSVEEYVLSCELSMSLTIKLKRRGPKIEHWGTPFTIRQDMEVVDWTLVICDLLVRQEAIRLYAEEEKADKCWSLDMSRLTVSKAFLISREITAI